MAGLFISLEGVEGAGKTTLIQKMVAYFGSCGKEVLLTREPGGSELGKKLRGIILNAEEKFALRRNCCFFWRIGRNIRKPASLLRWHREKSFYATVSLTAPSLIRATGGAWTLIGLIC